MPTRTRPGSCSFADFLELVREDQKADLIDGVIYMASPENLDHNDLISWLAALLRPFVEERRLGRITVNRVAYRLSSRTAPEPDLAFVRADRLVAVHGSYIEGPPDLAIEIVSPDSVERDYEHKRLCYQAAGVGEYWIIDAEDRKVTFLVNTPNGFEEVAPEGNVYRSRILPGFALDVGWLWQRPLPATFPILQSLLAGSSHDRP